MPPPLFLSCKQGFLMDFHPKVYGIPYSIKTVFGLLLFTRAHDTPIGNRAKSYTNTSNEVLYKQVEERLGEWQHS